MAHVRHLRALQAFNAAAERSNLSKAAEDLGVTHGAVSRQIKQLEQYLDVVLLRRLPSGVELTEAGTRLHLATRQAFGILEQGIEKTRRARKQRSIKISLSSSLAIKWLVPKLRDFRARYPGISVYLDTDDQVVDFADSDVDVALRFGSNQGRDLYCEHLMRERLVLVAAPSLVPEGAIAPASVAKLPLLHDQFHPHWDTWARAAGLHEPDVQSRSSPFPDSAVLIAAAIDGQGAALVRNILVADDIEAGRLVRLSKIGVEQDRSLLFVCRDGDEKTLPVSALRVWLTEVCLWL
ncbi:LysR substrate-binding domain-containing protein [Roseibium sp.]|uniref:LysR substrate-binding domain-containing protein n=1 Tax=Roseibium sp. TaxID=1936156 RepID=UPI003BAE7D7A